MQQTRRKHPTRQKRETRRRAQAELWQDGFNTGYDVAFQVMAAAIQKGKPIDSLDSVKEVLHVNGVPKLPSSGYGYTE